MTAFTLMGVQAGAPRLRDAPEHVVDLAEAAVHLLEDGRIEAVEAHGHALEPGRDQLGRMLGQQHAVGGQRDVLDARHAVEVGDQVRQVGAEQRLAPGQPQLAHPEGHEQPRQPHDLVEREPLAGAHELVLLVELLLRHAIGAAEVAAIHHGNAQIVHRTPERIARVPRIGEGTTVVAGGTERGMARAFLPPVQARDKSFGVGVRSGGQLDEAIRSGQGR